MLIQWWYDNGIIFNTQVLIHQIMNVAEGFYEIVSPLHSVYAHYIMCIASSSHYHTLPIIYKRVQC